MQLKLLGNSAMVRPNVSVWKPFELDLLILYHRSVDLGLEIREGQTYLAARTMRLMRPTFRSIHQVDGVTR